MATTTRDGTTQTSLAEINMVPFIDIVLVLLIIFMITTPVLESAIDVDVPETRSGVSVDEQRITITIDRELRIYLEDEPIGIEELVARIEPSGPDTERNIYLRSDETVPFATIAAVLDRLGTGGIRDVHLVTEPMASGS